MPKTSAPGFKADSPGGPTTARRPAQSAPAHPDESIPATDSLHRENYRAADAVDQVPVPVGEWAINTSLLPVSKPCVFVVTIWVSARGRLDKWEVQSDQISEERAAAVFEQFGDTVMNPALIGDVPVASVQRLELTIERQ